MAENAAEAACDREKPNLEAALKFSAYNHFIKYNEEYYIAYNFLYRSILKIPARAFQQIDALLNTGDDCQAFCKLPQQWLQALKEAKVLIDFDFDELSLIKMQYYRSLYGNDTLSLIILPTLWCNMQCPYCFENKRPVFMTKEIEDRLLDWVRQNFSQKRYIHVAWFGGEPLLGKNSIFKLTKGFQEICNENNGHYSASLTTNGYYLDHDFQAAIPALGIKHVQVTFDGDKDDHDKSRIHQNGRGSFDTLFKNVQTFCENVSESNLSIRVNCGDNNYAGIKNLLERFPVSVRNQASVFFRWIWANEATGFQEFSTVASGNEHFKGLASLYAYARNIGLKTANPHNKTHAGYCEVDFFDHYCIDPEGDFYFCSHSFNKAESIGSIFQEKGILHESSLNHYARWYTANPFADEKCMKCKLLPVCSGGCRKSRTTGKRECIEESNALDLYVESIMIEQYG